LLTGLGITPLGPRTAHHLIDATLVLVLLTFLAEPV
jgi:hypothetical protein